MKIKESSSSGILTSVYKVFINKRLLSIGIYSALLFTLGAVVNRAGIIGEIKISAKEKYETVTNYLNGLIANPKRIYINIKYEDFQRIAYKREIALKMGYLAVGSDDYVPATISYKDNSVRVKLRLKGDTRGHWKGEKWSYRVKVRGEETLFGLKIFSIHRPAMRNYIFEWIYHEALKWEGVLSLRYDFLHVTLNGKDMGIYALEEHFDKRLIENNQHREGPIIRFTENLFWDGNTFSDYKELDTEAYLSSDIDAFQSSKIAQDSSKKSQFLRALYLLESFRRGDLTTSEVFNVDKLAKFTAISDLMGGWHGNRWHNKKFYFNPISSKLEPIGFDGDCGKNNYSILIFPQRAKYFLNQFHQTTIFNDHIFLEKYIQELERFSETTYLDNLFSEIENELAEKLYIIYSDDSQFKFSKDDLYHNQNFIKKVLNPVKGMNVYFKKYSNNKIELEFGNIQTMPIEVLNIVYKDSILINLKKRIILSSKIPSKPVNYQNIIFSLPENFIWSDAIIKDLKAKYKVFGTSIVRYESVFPWSHLGSNLPVSDFLIQKKDINETEYLYVNETTKTIRIKPGAWELSESLIIPEGYRVICGNGVTLNLTRAAMIISYSPLDFYGSDEKRITISSSDSTGQGIAVMNTNELSVFEYVDFVNLSNPKQLGWELTGSVTFYESPVEISHCRFLRNRSEDALNIIRSDFDIDDSIFNQVLSDALDVDFSKGNITKSSFVECGNDGIDISGSVVNIEDVIIKVVGDKGLSSGEVSQMRVNSVDINSAWIAIASKDMSDVTLRNVNITGCGFALAVYEKKSEFGPASMKVLESEMTNNEVPYLLENQSTLIIDGIEIKSNQRDVYKLLYGGL